MAPCFSTMATKSIDDLPDWDLLQLMDRLHLIELVHLGRVNRRFNQLSKKCYSARKDLVLITGLPLWLYSNVLLNEINLPMLTYHNVECIQSLLPGLSRLVFYNYNSRGDEIAPIIHLLL